MPMLSVHVRHYFNSEGINFLKISWIEKRKNYISKQDGFINIEFAPDIENDELFHI